MKTNPTKLAPSATVQKRKRSSLSQIFDLLRDGWRNGPQPRLRVCKLGAGLLD